MQWIGFFPSVGCLDVSDRSGAASDADRRKAFVAVQSCRIKGVASQETLLFSQILWRVEISGVCAVVSGYFDPLYCEALRVKELGVCIHAGIRGNQAGCVDSIYAQPDSFAWHIACAVGVDE